MQMHDELIKLSKPFATGIDWVQAAGGNTSVKNGNKMLIKASGFRLSEISAEKGAVTVDFHKIKSYFEEEMDDQIGNQNAKAFVTNCIIGDQTFLPSMETGFHAVLKQYVIHTHPVFLNVLLCANNAEALISAQFDEKSCTFY